LPTFQGTLDDLRLLKGSRSCILGIETYASQILKGRVLESGLDGTRIFCGKRRRKKNIRVFNIIQFGRQIL
jgi:hypothetical protein